MSKRKSNFNYNYPRVIKYLQEHDIEYNEYNDGQHIKILGDTAYIELWPSRMTYHIIESEEATDTKYHRLSFDFNEQEFADLLA